MAQMWSVKEAVIKAAWRQVRLWPGDIEVLPERDMVWVSVENEDFPQDCSFETWVTFPDDQVMAVVRVWENNHHEGHEDHDVKTQKN